MSETVEQPAEAYAVVGCDAPAGHVWIVVIRSPKLAETIVNRAFWTLEAAERSIVKDRFVYGWGVDVVASCERISVLSDL